MNKTLRSTTDSRVPNHLMTDMASDRFMSAPKQVGVEVPDGIALSAEFHISRFEPDLFERLEIAKPTSVKRARDLRQAEFLAGRLIARHVLKLIVGHDSDILIGQDGMPIWPPGVCGSISHTRTSVYCAVAAGNSRRIGIDCEDIVSGTQAAELAKFVLSPAERNSLKHSALGLSEGLTLLFSAKECFFKAVYPILRRYIDFLDVEAIAIDEAGKTVSLAFLPTADDGLVPILDVRYILDAKKVVTIAR